MGTAKIDVEELVQLRHVLHRQPELSEHEAQTAAAVRDQLEGSRPDAIHVGLGGHGLAATYEGAKPGPMVLVRCDLDALPIEESTDLAYRSSVPGVSHKCGHDGHMSIAIGLARSLGGQRPARGRVVILFQPAEETGVGARSVLEDGAFTPLWPDQAFALHNLPGFPLGEVIVGRGPFSSASRGLVATLSGTTSHAAEPELGRSPALAMAQLIEGLAGVANQYTPFHEAALVTIIGARLGERAFGTSPGQAEVLATVRAHRDESMVELWKRADELVCGLAAAHGLKAGTQAVEDFPATRNDPACVEVVEAAARRVGAPIRRIERPFAWSEDFGHFSAAVPSALFGLGAGIAQPALHSPDYDFPDELIPVGVRLLSALVQEATKARTDTRPPPGEEFPGAGGRASRS